MVSIQSVGYRTSLGYVVQNPDPFIPVSTYLFCKFGPFCMNKSKLPWWTWIAPFAIFQFGLWVSGFFKVNSQISLFYLPIAFGILLVHWWGPRVALPMLVSSLVNSLLWMQTPLSLLTIIQSTHGPVCILLSWYLFRLKVKDGNHINDINKLYWFILLGIFIPVLANALYEMIPAGSTADRFRLVMLVLLPDFITNFAFTLPLLLFATPFVSRNGLTLYRNDHFFSFEVFKESKNWIEVISLMAVLFGLSMMVQFEQYWYIYGVVAIYGAIRFGFEGALAANLYIFLITYILPIGMSVNIEVYQEAHILNVHLGMCMLYLSATVMGRVISDVRKTRKELQRHIQELENANMQLKRTNQELDRFVYSVSHDLSAPLKSVKGLIGLSKYESDTANLHDYFEKILASVSKLEKFILEILDYSRNNRLETVYEKINVKNLVNEVLVSLEFMDNYQNIAINLQAIQQEVVVSDVTRLRVILNNLISNSIKYHRICDCQPYISISTEEKDNTFFLTVEDNGEGMSEATQERAFEMFYRGSDKSEGSGLGLYIAKESAEKINGTLTLTSEVGRGTIFTLALPINGFGTKTSG